MLQLGAREKLQFLSAFLDSFPSSNPPRCKPPQRDSGLWSLASPCPSSASAEEESFALHAP